MSDVSEAAERIKRAFDEDENSPLWDPEGQDQLRDDCLLLAREYLRLNPADNDTPIDEAWLRACGWVDNGTLTLRTKYNCCGLKTELCCMMGDTLNRWSIGQNVGGRILYVEIASCKTRGQLRDLCRSLGIPLGESHAG